MKLAEALLFSRFPVSRSEGGGVKRAGKDAFDLYAKLSRRTIPYHCAPPPFVLLVGEHTPTALFYHHLGEDALYTACTSNHSIIQQASQYCCRLDFQ